MGVSSFGIAAAVAVLLSSPCHSAAARMVEETWRKPEHSPSAESAEAVKADRNPALADQRVRIEKRVGAGTDGKSGKAKSVKSSSKHQSKEWNSESKSGKSGEPPTKSKIAKHHHHHHSKEWSSKSEVGKSGKSETTKSGKTTSSKSQASTTHDGVFGSAFGKSGKSETTKSGKATNSKSQASTTHDGVFGSAAKASASPAPTPKGSTNPPTNHSNERMNSSRPTIKTSDSPPSKAPEDTEGGGAVDFETYSQAIETTPVPSPVAVTATTSDPPTPPAPEPILVDFTIENYPLVVNTLRPTPPGDARSSPGRLEPTASVRSGGDTGGAGLGVPAIAGIVISALALVGAVVLLLASHHDGRRLQDEPRQEATGEDATAEPDLEAETDVMDGGV